MIVRSNPHGLGFRPFTDPNTVDKTRYLGFYTAGYTGNTGTSWLDESGHGYTMTAPLPDDVFVRTTDANSLPVFRSSTDTGGFLRFPFPAQAAGDYTVYTVIRPDSLQNPYLFDTAGHTLGLGFNNSDFGAWFGAGSAHGPGAISVAANELALITWRLSLANGGRIYKNGSLVYSAPYERVTLGSPACLGHDNSVYYSPFTGDLHAFVIRMGNDTDAEVAQIQTYLAGLTGITL